MLIHIPQVLTTEELRRARQWLAEGEWVDGEATAGVQAKTVKRNAQLAQQGAATQALQQLVVEALNRSASFFSAALPKKLYPPMFNRYEGERNTFGAHVDNAIRYAPGTGQRVRSDVSATLFLAEPGDYDGGELVIEDTFGCQHVKLAAGDLVLYPGTSVHRVEPVTRGARLASFFWIESMVRSDEARRLLYEMDQHLMHLRTKVGEADPGVVGLTGTYHNLLRRWADT
jgi:PKHD-type hydroxylase